MTMEGKTIRLRASCNACNESKVRCSQHKPTCERCERNGAECIYGLSRRTHKDAPSISMPSSQRPRRASPSSSNSDTNSNTTPTQKQNDSAATTATKATSHFNIYTQQAPIVAAADPKTHTRPGQLLDFSSPLTDSLSTVTCFPTPDAEAEYANHYGLGSFFAGNNNDGGPTTDIATFWAWQMATTGLTTVPPSPSPSCGECTCHAGVTELLASMRGSGDQRLSLDMQLAKLKQCIVSSETSMGCTHGRDDAEPIHIMAVATLIGYVVDHFEVLASESPLRRSLASEMVTLESTERGGKPISGMVSPANMCLGGLLEPRLSWGVLELEDDDEMDLRQRLYLLSFRKLERLLSQLTLYLRNLHDVRASLPDPSRHMAFVIACDYTRLWLEKKAEDVKRMLLVSAVSSPALVPQHIEL